MLDNHPKMFSGSELSFFNKERLYRNWSKWKYHLIDNKNFSTDGWFPYASHNLYHKSYGWSVNEVSDLIDSSGSMMEFIDIFFQRPLQLNNKEIWIEKTPSNAYGFNDFLSLSEKHKVIHMLRNPYDAVTSLVRRGMTPYFAAGLWVYNNSVGSSSQKQFSGRYHQVKYEDLVFSFDKTSSKLLDFIGFKGGLNEVNEGSINFDADLDAWNNSPSGKISDSSIGSFNRLDRESQEIIKQSIALFRIRDGVLRKRNLIVNSAEELCSLYGYEYMTPVNKRFLFHAKDLAKDFIGRSLKGYSTGLLKYPGKLLL